MTPHEKAVTRILEKVLTNIRDEHCSSKDSERLYNLMNNLLAIIANFKNGE